MYNDSFKKYLSGFFEFLLIFLIIFTPVFYGAVGILPLTIIEIVSFSLFLLFFSYTIFSGTKITYPANSYLLFIFILLIFLELVPLPAFLQRVISPKTFFLQQNYSGYIDNVDLRPLTLYSLPTQEAIIQLISFLIIFFSVINILEKKQQFNRVILVIIFWGLILSLYGLAKKYFILGKEITLSFATFGNRNHFAGYIVMVAPLAMGYALYNENNFKKFIFGFIAAILSASVFLSLSRAGSLSLIFSLLLMSFLLVKDGRIKKTYWLVALAVILALIFISLTGSAPIRNRFMLFVEGLFGRWKIVRDAAGIFIDFPLFGIGLGNFQYVFPLYQKEVIFPAYYQYLHNDHFELVVETGLIAAAFYFLFLFKIFRDIFSKFKSRHDDFVKGIVIGGTSGLLGVLFHSFFEFNFHIPAVSLLFYLLLGTLYKCVNTHFHQSLNTPDKDNRNERTSF
jgi:O-antigen ligase